MVRMPRELNERLEVRARNTGVPKNAHICLAVEAYLNAAAATG